MAKIGRNDPCPCGSGKKYKKCCRERDEQAARQHARAQAFRGPGPASGPMPAWFKPPEVAAGAGMSAYTAARLFERSERFARMLRDEPGRAQKHWTPARLAALDTDDILSRLRALGVDGRPEAFLPLAQETTCAWDVSTAWRQALSADGRELDRHADDFLGLSACELWKRTCPERPSQEMLDDWMQAGYELSMEREARRACDRWLKVWEVIRSRLTPGMRTCEDAEVIFNGTQSIFNWIQDFASELLNAGAEDPRYAARGAEVCEQVLEQFGDEGGLFGINFRCDLGELLFKAGRAEQGERVLLGLMEDHPDHPAGYQRLAIMLGFSSRPEEPPRDRARAIALLEAALARPVKDPERWGVREWLADLKQPDSPKPGDGPESAGSNRDG